MKFIKDHYNTISLIIILITVLLSSYGNIAKYIYDVTSYNMSDLLWIQPVIGPKKLFVLRSLFSFSLAFLAIASIVRISRNNLFRTVATLASSVIIISSTWLWVEQSAVTGGGNEWESRFSFRTYGNLNYSKMFDKSIYTDDEINNFQDFNKAVNERYNEIYEQLKIAWPGLSEEHVRAFFYLNTVNSLWGGADPEFTQNPQGIDRVQGCILAGVNREDVTVRTYLDVDRACCTDYASMLLFLFDQNGYDANMFSVPGHWMNMVEIGGKWWTFDPTSNTAFSASWDEIYKGPSEPRSIVVNFFPSASTFFDDPQKFTNIGFVYRAYVTTWAVNRSRPGSEIKNASWLYNASPWFSN